MGESLPQRVSRRALRAKDTPSFAYETLADALMPGYAPRSVMELLVKLACDCTNMNEEQRPPMDGDECCGATVLSRLSEARQAMHQDKAALEHVQHSRK